MGPLEGVWSHGQGWGSTALGSAYSPQCFVIAQPSCPQAVGFDEQVLVVEIEVYQVEETANCMHPAGHMLCCGSCSADLGRSKVRFHVWRELVVVLIEHL